MRNNDLNVHVFQKRKPRCNPKSDRRLFFSNFYCKKKNWEKYGGTGFFSGKNEAMHAKLNERAEAATSSYSAAVDF